MSNLPTPVEPEILQAVTGGTTPRTPRTPSSSSTSTDTLLQTLNSLSSTLTNIGNASSKSGFSTTDILLLGFMLSQQHQVNVFVRRPFW
jgi:hypothetical protein